ncbi:MAG: hypothetical protein MJA27_30225 [Pseudanabaenales cyanobacterium]|nr:hypothetical protein [Pseudanabaenales cyanobacterium]
MARKKTKKRLFSGMSYRDVQRSNSDRRGKLPQKDQKWLKEKGYRNVGWDNVIKLYQKINELLIQPTSEEDTLEELFLQADRIGNKYQTPEEIAAFNQQLLTEVNEISDEIDRQFPNSEMEFIDYSQPSRKSK